MTRQKVTRDAVLVAIDAIRNKGGEPSINKVLEITGGSKSTVAAIMREVNAEAEAAPRVIDFPPAVATAMEQAAAAIWTAAQTAAREQFDLETRRYLARTTQLENDIADLAVLTDQAENERDQAIARIETLEIQNRELEMQNRSQAEHQAMLAKACSDAREEVDVITELNGTLERDLSAAKLETANALTRARFQAEMVEQFQTRFEALIGDRLAGSNHTGNRGTSVHLPGDIGST